MTIFWPTAGNSHVAFSWRERFEELEVLEKRLERGETITDEEIGTLWDKGYETYEKVETVVDQHKGGELASQETWFEFAKRLRELKEKKDKIAAA